MPTYEYVCGSCRRHTEAQQSFTDPPLTECPHCGGPLKRVFHPVGIVLKGSGFYSTDNRSSRRGAADPASKDTKDAKTTDAAAAPAKTETAAPSESATTKPAKDSGTKGSKK